MKNKIKVVLISFLCVILLLPTLPFDVISADDTTGTNGTTEATDEMDQADFDKTVTALLMGKNFSGTILVMRKGKVLYENSMGYSNYAKGKFNTEHTSYEIDSVQKALTAAMIMKQVEKGKLSLNDKLHKFYPEIKGSKKITIRQMLDMTSGLMMPTQIGPNQVMSDDNILKADIEKLHFSNAYYNRWLYSPINFNLLSGILEKVTGKSYRYMFTKTYIKKLHLKHTIFAYDKSPHIDKAAGYSNIDPLSAKADYRNAFRTNKFYTYDELGTGQVYMSAEDLYKAENYIVAGKMLTKKSRKELFKSGSKSSYGGGFYNRKHKKFANGWGYGFQSVIHISNDGKDSVVVLENYQRLAADIKPTVVQIYNMLNNY
ncbi:serine hydrolase domain-containing protein [Companilactobacillus hulinensis]|uniref:serine hydrolase domain-containing protein n=1 Tax=Companilactobacillus hulinensis TaxID=2486007 RepID=UPI000F7937DA|nr:serine hydrolase domain-containing protein [Companilactobacillus hulinensis]